ncbi:MAG: serine/threonine-protein kinase [Planctomyces sp.]
MTRSPSCPATTELQALAGDSLQAERRHLLELHVEQCRQCQTLLQQIAELQSVELATGPIPLRVRPPVPSEIAGCRLLRVLGRGSRSEVWLAEEQQMQRTVAVKLLPAEGPDRESLRGHWLAEVRLAAGLAHPGLVRLYRAEESASWFVLIFEYVAGGTLKDHGLCRDPEQAVKLTLALTAAVQYMHDQGILHLDLKPANVLLEYAEHSDCSDCLPKISDFGISLRQSADASHDTTRVAGLGTPPWMAPEQLLCQISELTAAADICGLGGILYFLLTGQPPYSGETVESLLEQMLGQEPTELPSEFCPELRLICRRCLQRQPESRWSSVRELRIALADWLDRRAKLRRQQRQRLRSRLLTATAALVVLLPVTLLWSGTGGSEDTRIRSEADFQRWLARPAEALDAHGAEQLVEAAAVRLETLLLPGSSAAAADLGIMLGRAGARLDASLQTETYPAALQLLQQSERLLEAATQSHPMKSGWHEELIATRVALAGSKANPPGIAPSNRTAHAAWRRQQLLRALPTVSRLAELRQQVFWAAEILDNLAHRSLISEAAAYSELRNSLPALLPNLLQAADIRARLLLLSDTTSITDEFIVLLADPGWVFPAGRTTVIKSAIAAHLQQRGLPALAAGATGAAVQIPDHTAILQNCCSWLAKLDQNSDLVAEILHGELIRAVAEKSTNHRSRNELAAAESIQREYVGLCEAAVRQFPENSDALLALSEAHLQAWKNSLRRDQPLVAVRELENSLRAAEQALRVSPGSQRARFQVANRLSRLAAFRAAQ